MFTLQLDETYGYVIGVGVVSAITMNYLGYKVASVRKKFKVDYPFMYADKEEALKDLDKFKFNCYQRAHQNALEIYPQFLMLLFVGGLKHPIISSVAGLVWIIGRLAYASGYYTGDPKKRSRGSFHYLGLLTLLGTTISTSLSMLGWLNN